jgi:phospholipid transport system substrate-binding protein
MRLLRLVAWLGALLLAAPGFAQEAPDKLVGRVISALGAALKADEVALKGEGAVPVARGIVTREVAPYMDFAGITREAVGPAWARASAPQREAVEREFRALLIHVLARLLVTNREDVLDVEPPALAPDATEVVLRLPVTRGRAVGNPPPPMLVTMRRGTDGWKVHELRTDGIDVVRLYSANFAVVIERGGGIDGLIKALADRNARNAESLTPRAQAPR